MRKLVWVGIVGILAGSVAGWALHRPIADPSPAPRAQTQDADSSPAQPAPRTVTLDPDAVKDMGLAVTTLKAIRHAPRKRRRPVGEPWSPARSEIPA